MKLLLNKNGRALGVQMVGFHAGDLIHEWVAVLNGRVNLPTIAKAIHAYPTLAEISKTAGWNYFVSASLLTQLKMLLNR